MATASSLSSVIAHWGLHCISRFWVSLKWGWSTLQLSQVLEMSIKKCVWPCPSLTPVSSTDILAASWPYLPLVLLLSKIHWPVKLPCLLLGPPDVGSLSSLLSLTSVAIFMGTPLFLLHLIFPHPNPSLPKIQDALPFRLASSLTLQFLIVLVFCNWKWKHWKELIMQIAHCVYQQRCTWVFRILSSASKST